MSLKVIELNDTGIKVADESGIVLLSPGFALAQEKKLLLGEAAEQQARLHPTSSFNKYWHELSLDPLSHRSSIRHHADIAYAQLLHLAELGNITDDVLFAVPGNFTRAQLAILLGLAKQCPFQTIGVVDSALAAAVSAVEKQPLVYAELQLHQVLLTKLKVVSDKLAVETVAQVPGVGSQNVIDKMMQLATNAFIQQCRFNPQHNAESEQQLYNALPHWWRQPGQNESGLVLELRVGNTVHTAKIPRESIVNSLGNFYQKIIQQLATVTASGNVQVMLHQGLAGLPGLPNLLETRHKLKVMDPVAVSASCLHFHEHIRSGEKGMRLVTTLPLVADSSGVKGSAQHTIESAVDAQSQHQAGVQTPTHLLYCNRAFALDTAQISNSSSLNGHTPANTIQLSLDGLPEQPGKVQVKSDGVYLDSGSLEFLLNDKRVSGAQQLALGDRIRFSPDSAEITVIRMD